MPEYKRQPVIPVMMVAAGMVFILGALFWSMSLGRGLGAAVGGTPSAAIASRTESAKRIPYPNVPRVNVADAKAAHNDNTAIFIDTRGEPYFAGGHIPNAISMTVDEVVTRMGELDRTRWIITYCT